MMELFRNPNYDFLGKAKYFIGFSVIVLVAGCISMVVRGFNLGVDFAGGTKMTVRFVSPPDENRIREALRKGGYTPDKVVIQRTGKQLSQSDRNEVFINTPQTEADVDGDKRKITEALQKYYGAPADPDKLDINLVGASSLATRLTELDVLDLKKTLPPGEAEREYRRFADHVIQTRDAAGGTLADLKAIPLTGFDPKMAEALEQAATVGAFNVVSAEIVGPQVGKDLRNRAIIVTIVACIGMLLFIAFRFEWVYGVAAVIAVVHDVLVTLGLFSLFQWEISLTFIAAMLTLVGYSMNDTIVIFDRIREQLAERRRDDLAVVTNDAINQTLSRTVITSGLTLLSVLALVLFGGEVLKSFSLALLVGILFGTYSSIAIASPILLWWKRYLAQRQPAAVPAEATTRTGGEKRVGGEKRSGRTAKSAPTR
ncbi:protein translocase subunit SecF [Chloracidobacterium thermophilum]|uniref:Protein-export membrane protein SecF n=1 Tax=Chloracidobacterium thermophilum (strain B) TaxID=981222 RepID=G2LGE1_CHLTF|nr:protein translocase subunit SecF [Chloracidobacterium thermophilum]AEP10901.1 protein-export membrane protein SecF [Chloracidobacterium thermophilum B]QUV78830.1 protein translocase subunit SecF [Chloracidobacterium thermophilum]